MTGWPLILTLVGFVCWGYQINTLVRWFLERRRRRAMRSLFGDGSDGHLHVREGETVVAKREMNYRTITIDKGGDFYANHMMVRCKGSTDISGFYSTAAPPVTGQGNGGGGGMFQWTGRGSGGTGGVHSGSGGGGGGSGGQGVR